MTSALTSRSMVEGAGWALKIDRQYSKVDKTQITIRSLVKGAGLGV